MANKNLKGTHYQGPLLGNADARGGLFADVPLAAVEAVRSPYQIHVEDFRYPFADGNLAVTGWTETAIDTPDTPLETMDADAGFLVIDPGDGNDDGSQFQYKAAPTGPGSETPNLDILGPMTSTATLMDNREMLYETRVGFASETTTWQAKAIMGWITDDTTLLDPATTGLPTIAAGGGTGFNVAEDGTLGCFSTNAAVTSCTDTGYNVLTDVAAASTGAYVWYTLGFRTRWVDASAGTGHTTFYVNGKKTNTITDTMPMDSTEPYSITYGVLNGPAGFGVLMGIDYLISGVTRPGFTWPYTSTAW